MGPPSPRRDRRARRPPRSGLNPAALQSGPYPSHRTRHAPAGRPLLPRPRQAVPSDRRPNEGPRAPNHGDDDVPRNGHGVLAGESGGGTGSAIGTHSKPGKPPSPQPE